MSMRASFSALADDPATTPPQRIGKYPLVGILGVGAMGTVYKGIDPLLQRMVAVKVIRAHLFDPASSDLSAALRFRNEAQAAARLSHPGIVGIYEYGEEGSAAYIAMEYLRGADLGRYMRLPQRLARTDVLSVMVQLLDALHYAHEQGVWHRDVKPANIIITDEGRLKVTDFGIARMQSSELTQAAMLIGSPGFIAPERYTGETPDRRVDVFSCGALLYQLLTGAPAFAGSDSEVMYKVLHQPPVPPSQLEGGPALPPCFDAIVAKALARRVVDRYASALEFRDALLGAASGPIPRTLSGAALRAVAPFVDDGRALVQSRICGAAPPLATRPNPPSLVAPPAAFDAGTLDRLESSLAHHVGPIAKLLVKRAAKHCADLRALAEHLAAESLAPEHRRDFFARIRQLDPGLRTLVEPGSRPPAGPPTLLVPVRGATPLTTQHIEDARRALAAHIGPIAQRMAKSAASISQQREQFHAVLAELSSDCVDRQQLLAELSRLA